MTSDKTLALLSLTEHAGVQMAKMSPLRSYVVTSASTLISTVVFSLRLGGGMTTYINVSLAIMHMRQQIGLLRILL